MSQPLPSHLAKLGRVRAHLSLLRNLAGSLRDSGAYAVFTEHDLKTGEVVIYGEARGEPPTSEWAS